MYYSTHYKTKWHDTDGDGVMRPSALLVYMQETANIQCREYGMDLTDLHHIEGKGFLLSRIMIKIFSPLRAYEDIEVLAYPVLRHRMKVNYTAVNDKLGVDEVISMIIKETKKAR